MSVLVTGALGQLGSDVMRELISRGIDCVGADIGDFNITNRAEVEAFFDFHRPEAVIHTAAYTAVDKAEDDEENCLRVNHLGTANIAGACARVGAAMLHVSTDYVLEGGGDEPLETDAPTGPQSAYGKSKLLAELAVREALDEHFIVRISWIYGLQGANFVKTMLRLNSEGRDIRVVNDQFGSPTYTRDLAVLFADIVLSDKYGTYHATNEGFCSWYDFACAIFKLLGTNKHVEPVSSEQFKSRAQRPANSRLSKRSLDEAGFHRLPPWDDALARYIKELSEMQ